jgi:hypothetical protein
MKQLFLIMGISFITMAATAQSVSSTDLKMMTGNWTGQLTYLDYTSNKQESIKAALAVEMKNEHILELAYSYPAEKGYGGKDKFRLRENGTMINDMKVIERSIQPDGALKIVIEEKGKDGNDSKKATFHHVILAGKDQLTITKLVKFDDEENFFQRNQYVFAK